MQRSWVDVACQAYGVGCWKEQGYCEEVAKGNTRSSWSTCLLRGGTCRGFPKAAAGAGEDLGQVTASLAWCLGAG